MTALLSELEDCVPAPKTVEGELEDQELSRLISGGLSVPGGAGGNVGMEAHRNGGSAAHPRWAEAGTDSGLVGSDIGSVRPGGCTLPGGFAPVLRVGGTLYEWSQMSVRLFLDPSGSYCSSGDGSTYLPEGFQPCGEISGITLDTPTTDLQLQAGFEASGTVFASEEHPAVVYVLMTTTGLRIPMSVLFRTPWAVTSC